MINTLVSLNADLASSIAYRYSCLLTALTDIRLQPIHVEEVDKEGYPPGSGWVRSTWEKGLIQTAQEEISQLINTEKDSCPPVDNTLVCIGDREDELLKEIEVHSYDLLLEGVLSSFDAQLFHKKVRSKLYRHAPCPIILVKNLVNPGRMGLLLGDLQDVTPVVSTFLKLFQKSKLAIDLVYYVPIHGGEKEAKQTVAEATIAGFEPAGPVFDKAKAMLADHGWTPAESWIIRNSPKNIGEMLGEYGLVGATIPRSTTRKNLAIDLLSRVPSATLLCK